MWRLKAKPAKWASGKSPALPWTFCSRPLIVRPELRLILSQMTRMRPGRVLRLRTGPVSQGVAQSCAGRYAELGKGPVEMASYSPG